LLSVCSRRLSRDDDSELQLMVSLELLVPTLKMTTAEAFCPAAWRILSL
jgi:hypothetical protein